VAELARTFSAVVIGSGAALSAGSGEGAGSDRFDIAMVARIGAEKPLDAERPKPLYLRGPDAKPQTGFALAHI
jgi:tRNA threonylcarbamoyladenosine biosynthesis protein TsaB